MKRSIGIIGGGAAGFFLAANLGEQLGEKTILLEQAKQPMQKIRISGGGRCNVTHACFDPAELVEFYPRGKKELRSVFHQFQPGDTMAWFTERGVELKIEKDNRVFPISDNSMSIVNCLWEEAIENGVEVRLSEGVKSIEKLGDEFLVRTNKNEYHFAQLILCTGSSNKSWKMIEQLKVEMVSPVPSLFTFNCNDERIKDLQGISFQNVKIQIPEIQFEEEGDLLITHWGFSGPAVLKLSARAAVELHKIQYDFDVQMNFLNQTKEEILIILQKYQKNNPKKDLYKSRFLEEIPKRFWERLLTNHIIPTTLNYANLSKKQSEKIVQELTQAIYPIKGKSTFKDEFVTAGGVDLKEIDFKTMQSKQHKNLYIAGEALNIDALTGGFNFQACWSEAFIISESLKEKFI